MGKRLYVGNLAWAVDDQRLKETFSAAGDVDSASVVTDRESGRSRGFGFVEMATDEGAAKAIEELHDKDVEGRKLNVSEARPQKDRGPRGGGGGGGGRGRY